MAATRRTGTLMLLSRLSKLAMRATPESEMGMSYRHFMTLYYLDAPIQQSELAASLCIDANNTVLLLNELERKGWVVRERDHADRRRQWVAMTDAGRAAYEHAQLSRDTVEGAVLGPLDESERRQLHDLLAKALGEAPR